METNVTAGRLSEALLPSEHLRIKRVLFKELEERNTRTQRRQAQHINHCALAQTTTKAP
jgi:hypothetical protein